MSTIADLKTLRAELIERRREEAYLVGGAYSDDRIAKLSAVHHAIAALDAVIEEGQDRAEADSIGELLVL
ncbi:hypothetical protein V1281_002563 [Nitrobacteraceae bacterium AZCC 2161]